MHRAPALGFFMIIYANLLSLENIIDLEYKNLNVISEIILNRVKEININVARK